MPIIYYCKTRTFVLTKCTLAKGTILVQKRSLTSDVSCLSTALDYVYEHHSISCFFCINFGSNETLNHADFAYK